MRRILILIAAALAALVPLAAPAAAHGGDGEVRVAGVSGTTDGIRIVVDLFYEDLDPVLPADDLFILAFVEDADGREVARADDYTRGDRPGRYVLDVVPPGPGDWQVTITTTNPIATTGVLVEDVAEPVGGTASTVFGFMMIVGVGAVLAAVAVWLWRRDGTAPSAQEGPTAVGAGDARP